MARSRDIHEAAGRSVDAQVKPPAADHWPLVAAVLGALGAWSIVVPYLGPPLGFDLDVLAKVEIVDHVVPGSVIVACSMLGLSLLRRGRSGSLASLGIAAAIVLAGLWITTTHVPLLLDAGRGVVPWATACFHTASGPLILALGVALALHEARTPEPV